MVTLPEGVVDFQANTPPRDTLLLAPAATLVAKKDRPSGWGVLSFFSMNPSQRLTKMP